MPTIHTTKSNEFSIALQNILLDNYKTDCIGLPTVYLISFIASQTIMVHNKALNQFSFQIIHKTI